YIYMKCNKNKIFNFLVPLINQKINNINLAIKIKIIKENLYDDFVENIYHLLSKEIKNIIVKKINEIDLSIVKKRLDEIITLYLKTL
ncbi:MAG: hypothetical protein K2I36_00145, partial [Ureaplasma sp.]|nr:hypothetical protein [Ureaplasma sp.]